MIQPWFANAKLGIFVHWGIYSVGMYEPSWAFFNHGRPGAAPDDHTDRDTYLAQRHAFCAQRYRPEAWAELFREAGARYSVLTTKHPDGFCLWGSAGSLNAVADAPARRDLVSPFVTAMHGAGLKAGLYYTHGDWGHADYPSVRKADGCHLKPGEAGYRYCYPDGPDNLPRWERFLSLHRRQIRELCEGYRPDLLWFDTDWERTTAQWRFPELVAWLRQQHPQIVLNSRLGHDSGLGDYATPEQGLPLAAPKGPWELCLTMNRGWGVPLDPSYKTEAELLRTFQDVLGMGGNLLLNVSPFGDGSLHQPQVDRLKTFGRWTTRCAEAIYPTGAGLPPGHFAGPSTLSADRTVLYLIQQDRPWSEIPLKGLRNRVLRASIVGCEAPVGLRQSGGASWMGIPGILWLHLPEAALDPLGTVVKLELEGPLDLYVGAGAVVTQN